MRVEVKSNKTLNHSRAKTGKAQRSQKKADVSSIQIEALNRLNKLEVGKFLNLHGLGRLLIELRLARGFTQADLARQLGVDVSQVSRDERYEYRGIILERAIRILDALNANLVVRLEPQMFQKRR